MNELLNSVGQLIQSALDLVNDALEGAGAAAEKLTNPQTVLLKGIKNMLAVIAAIVEDVKNV